MNNFIRLVKIQLLSLFSNSTMRFSARKKGFVISAVLFPALLFLYISCMYTFGIMMALPAGQKDIALYLMSFLSFMLLLVFAFYSADGHLFGFKDYDLLSSLPISKGSLISSKIVSFYLLEFFYSVFLYYPALMIYGITAKMGFMYYVIGCISGLFMPLLPIVLSSIFSLIISLASRRFKYSHLINNLLSIVMIGLVFVGTFLMQNMISGAASDLTMIKNNLIVFIPFVGLMIQGFIEGNWFGYFMSILLQVIPFVLFLLFFSKKCTKINSKMKIGYRVKNYRLQNVKESSVMNALIMKEVRRYFSSAAYVINSLVGPIMVLVAAVYGLVKKEMLYDLLQNMPEEFTSLLFVLILVMMSGLCLMSCTTNSSISLEGKNLWILKSAPISTEMIFKAKIALNLFVLIPFMCLATLATGFIFSLTILEIVLILIGIIAASLLTAQFGLILNLIFPRFDWDKEIYVVKQSMPVMISVFTSMGFIFASIFALLNLVDVISPLMIACILNGLFIVLNVCCSLYLKTKGMKLFEKL